MLILDYRGGPSSRHIHTQCLAAPFINDVADTNGRRYLQEVGGDASVQAHRAISLKDVPYNSNHTAHFLGPSNICDYCKTKGGMAIMNCICRPVQTWIFRMWHLRFWGSEYETYSLLGCDPVHFGKQVPAFWRDKLLHFLPASPPLPLCKCWYPLPTYQESYPTRLLHAIKHVNAVFPFNVESWTC